MKIKALALFVSAIICRSTMGTLDTAEHTGTPDSKPERLFRYLSMERRESDEPGVSDDASLCFFIKEKDESSHISCKHRLTRSKFNYNPFGLRFGKRNEATDTHRPKHNHLPPIMLYLSKQLETS